MSCVPESAKEFAKIPHYKKGELEWFTKLDFPSLLITHHVFISSPCISSDNDHALTILLMIYVECTLQA